MRLSFIAAAAAFLFASMGAASAHQTQAGDLTIEHPHARIVIPSRPGAAYFIVHNKGAADELVRAATPAFGRVELHTHKMEGETMRMIEVEKIAVPAAGKAELKSGGDHVMLFEPTGELKVGDSFPMVLTFAKQGDVEITVVVAPLEKSGGMDHSGHKDHSGHSGH